MLGRWDSLEGQAPNAEDLTATYQGEGTTDAYGDLLGGPSQLEGFGASGDQTAALNALRQMYESGGYTAQDRNAERASEAQNAQQVGSMNQAALRQMEARGMGGSGASLAAQMGGSQALANANRQSGASIQQAAMQRALAALQGYSAQGNTMQGQELARRGALDAYNQQNMDWRRGREQRNTAWGNESEQSRANAQQQAYSNRERRVAGSTGQYNAGAGERQFGQQRQDQANQAGAGVIGSILSEIL